MSGFSLSAFRHRVALERPVTAPDGAGGETVAYVPVRSLWARVRHKRQGRATEAGRQRRVVDYTITIRRWTDIEPGWRVVFDEQPLLITEVAPTGRRLLYLKLSCVGDVP